MKALAFDFDGVIADTHDLNWGLCEEVGHAVNKEDFMRHHDGNVHAEPTIPFTEESAKKFFQLYNERVTGVRSFFSVDHLNELNKNYSLHIVSSNIEVAINNYLNHHQLTQFHEILGMDFDRSKVNKLNYILSTHKIKKDDLVFITDTLGDILEAHEVGVKAIAVDFGFHDRSRLEKGNPHAIVSSFEELKAELEQLN